MKHRKLIIKKTLAEIIAAAMLFAAAFTMPVTCAADSIADAEGGSQDAAVQIQDTAEPVSESAELQPDSGTIITDAEPEVTELTDDEFLPALTVKLDGDIAATFTADALAQLTGETAYDYSMWSKTPEWSELEQVSGPTVAAILDSAGVSGSLTDTGTVSFTNGTDTVTLTGAQLNETRYFYPSGGDVEYAAGTPAEQTRADAAAVPAIISLADGTLCIGQAGPGEQNAVLFISGLTSGGTVSVSTAQAARCDASITTDPAHGTLAADKTSLSIINGSANATNQMIYYTTDKTGPNFGSALYNYSASSVCKPVLTADNESVTLTVRVKEYGKRDASLYTGSFYVGNALTVKIDGELARGYARPEDVTGICDAETCTYSGYNTYPTFKLRENVTGIPVDRIIKDATGKDVSEFPEYGTIRFTGADGASTMLTFKQLFGTTRYCYPNGGLGTADEEAGETEKLYKGAAAAAESYEGKTEVPCIIDTRYNEAEGKCKYTLHFGQIAPNEQNIAECIDYMMPIGRIEICTDEEQTETASIGSVFPAAGDKLAINEPVDISVPVHANYRDKIYYVVDPEDGEEPDYGSAMYYYAPFWWSEDWLANPSLSLRNQPSFSEYGPHTIKYKVTAYGKKDSDVLTYNYDVSLAGPSSVKASATAYGTIKVTWKKNTKAKGYKVYRSEAGGPYKLVKTIKKNRTVSYTNTGLKTGTTYRYAVASTGVRFEGRTIETAKTRSGLATPALKTPTLKLTSGSKLIKLKWTKIAGASGYDVYRADAADGEYALIKNISKGGTCTYTDKGRTKGQRYYYKVLAYRKVSGIKVFADASAVKSAVSK